MSAHPFDTDAISGVLKQRPSPACVTWLQTVPRDLQHVSSVSVGELYKGAYRFAAPARHLNIDEHVLPRVAVLPYDIATAQTFAQVSAELERKGTPLADADVRIAATAPTHDLELVTGETLCPRQAQQGTCG